MIEDDQQSPKWSLIEQQNECERCRVAQPVALRSPAPAPNQEGEHHDEGQAACYAVDDFDYRLRLCTAGEDFAVTQRPVIAAACAGSGGPNVRAPQDHDNVACEC